MGVPGKRKAGARWGLLGREKKGYLERFHKKIHLFLAPPVPRRPVHTSPLPAEEPLSLTKWSTPSRPFRATQGTLCARTATAVQAQ